MSDTRHLYVHLPFCAHRCGYCDFVTVVGREEQHRAYVDALLRELDLEGHHLGELETIFLGGGTPTFTALPELVRLLEALPAAEEVTVEANPETVTPELARALRTAGVSRVSLGAQSFRPELLRVLERTAGPDDIRGAFVHLRAAGFDNLSLDLIYGIPGQSVADTPLPMILAGCVIDQVLSALCTKSAQLRAGPSGGASAPGKAGVPSGCAHAAGATRTATAARASTRQRGMLQGPCRGVGRVALAASPPGARIVSVCARNW